MMPGSSTDDLMQRIGVLFESDTQFCAALPSSEVSRAMLEAPGGLPGALRALTQGYADRPALGERVTSAEVDPVTGIRKQRLLNDFRTISYGELWDDVTAVARAWSQGVVNVGDRVATLGTAGIGYTTVDLAVALLGAVSVPLHTGARTELLAAMVAETEPVVIASSIESLADTVELIAEAGGVTVVVLDHDDGVDAHREVIDAARRRLRDAATPAELRTLTEVIAAGRRMPATEDWYSDPERLALVIYTSGSSGSPKGAMQSEAHIASAWMYGARAMLQRGFSIPSITLNYLPMSHTGGRSMLYSTLGVGGTAYFTARADLSAVLADLALVRPTQLNFIPRIWEMLYEHFRHDVEGRCADGQDHPSAESAAISAIRNDILGGRYITALTGSAPITPELAAWVQTVLDTHLMDGFGATESGSVAMDGKIQMPPVTDYRLVDVPELGYFSTDRPYPRGELTIKSTALFIGYYRRPDLTAEAFGSDGFYRTGDVVAELGPGQVRYIDRRNNVVKLSQGEFIAIAALENTFTGNPDVAQIYVYANSARPYPLAVVVPSAEARAAHSGDDLKSHLQAALADTVKTAGLQPYELPRDIIVETNPFTLGNGLLTGINKLSRPGLKQRYGQRLEQLYIDHDEHKARELDDLRRTGPTAPVLQTVCRAANAQLGTASADLSGGIAFTDLGGDSLSALAFSNLLCEIFGVEVPVSEIVSPTADLAAIAAYIEAVRSRTGARADYATVHGADSTEVRAADLTLDRFIDDATLAAASSLPAAPTDVRTVLLTGATGFLGRYLALAWLEHMQHVGGTVICLVRGRDRAQAEARLDATFDSGDPALLSYWQRLSPHLRVVVGDKAQPNLGLDSETWEHLARNVDLIVDSAALVNHMLPYSQLFGPNTAGTAELIRLALTSTRKPYTYISTVGVCLGATDFGEDTDIRSGSASRRIDDSYAGGYATSKWGGEVLLREANDLADLPVSVFRCSMILADTTFGGQLNLPDLFTRTIFSVLATGLAPESFHRLGADGQRQRAHYDGLSVEFIASAVRALTPRAGNGFSTYNVVNPHDDGFGMDEFVDWLIAAGYPIERIRDYPTWFTRFASALRNLPEPQRQNSLLPLLDNYRQPQFPMANTVASSDRFRAAVAKAGVGADGTVPPITPAMVTKYASDLQLIGLLRNAATHEGTKTDE